MIQVGGMSHTPPTVVVLGGINGAGKTTASREILVNVLRIPRFVNADTIARGLNAFDVESEAVRAGRIMLEHLRELAAARLSFAFETTLAARTYAPWLESLRAAGYETLLYYYWLNSPDTAVARVATRVQAGGHHIPEETIRRRYARSVRNFLELYRPIADEWRVYDNSKAQSRLIAFGIRDHTHVLDGDTWLDFERSAANG
jgi:predicted ABC-type ATPase